MANNLIPSDAPSVFDSLSTDQLNALAYPSPLPNGIAGLVFDWTGSERLELRSESTDSFVEDNTAVHDQIALYPEKFTVDAATAEIVFAPGTNTSPLSQNLNPLALVVGLLPTITPGSAAAMATQAINGSIQGLIPNSIAGLSSILSFKAAQVIGTATAALPSFASLPATLGPLMDPILGAIASQTAGSSLGQAPNTSSTAVAQKAGGLYGYYQGLSTDTVGKQATVMGFIYQLWLGRVRFTVETPWGIMKSMIIEYADGEQPEDSNGVTNHKITFKKFRIVQDGAITQVALSGRSYAQASAAVPNLNGGIGQLDVTSGGTAQILQNWRSVNGSQ